MNFWALGVGATKSRYAPRAASLGYKAGVAWSQQAEKLQFAVFGTTEHHFEYNGWWGGALLSLASIALRTKTIRLGPATMLLPLHDPLRVAEDAAMLDVISGGRLVLGFGYGYRPMEFLGLGPEKKTRGARLVEQMQLIQMALSQETFSYHGKHYHYDNVRVRPRPIQQPPPMWFQAGTSFAAATRAGKAGFWYMCANVSFDDFNVRVAEYYRAADEAGVPRSRLKLAAVKDMIIARTRDEAIQIRDTLVRETYYGEHITAYGYLVDREGGQVFDESKQEARIQHWVNSIWVGTPDDAIAEYERYEAMGVDSILNIAAPGDLFTTVVKPHFDRKRAAAPS